MSLGPTELVIIAVPLALLIFVVVIVWRSVSAYMRARYKD
jgi:type III secretory pathway component EscR